MTLPTKEEVLILLRSGTLDERVAFLRRFPSGDFFANAQAHPISSDNPSMIVAALEHVTLRYCEGQHPDWGAVLAAALHERAVELWQTDRDHAVLPNTMSRLACGHVIALTLLGRSSEVLDATEQYIVFYENLGEAKNLATLRSLRSEALMKRLHEENISGQPKLSARPQQAAPRRRSTRDDDHEPQSSGAAPEDDSLGLDAAMSAPATLKTLAPLPETRWLNAEIRDHDKREPLKVGTAYVIEFGIDLQAAGDASTTVPSSALLFKPGEDLIELTILLQSSDFQIAVPDQKLQLPRSGASVNKARFDVTTLRAGRGTLTALVCKDGNFLLRMDVAYSIGTVAAEPPSTESFGRPIAAAANLRPRRLSLIIKPAPAGGYECTMIADQGSKTVTLPITEADLGDAIKTAREGLMSVITQRDPSSRLVFQTSVDVDEASAVKALQTLARTGARLFQRLFFGPAAGIEVQQMGEWLRSRAMNPKERLTLQIVSTRFPVPWGLLYLGKVDRNATLDWDSFLGMGCVIEQLPLVNSFVADSVIPSDQPSLAISININQGIDEKMKTDVVARQLKFWQASVAMLGPSLQFAERQSRADVLDALMGDANDQLMYLYCHAVTAGPGDAGGISSSCLILTGDERLTLEDLNREAPMNQPLRGNPLVFINACESAELTPAFYDGFVPYFMAKSARGVIGTECKTPAVFATEWALRFFPRFLGGEPLGELFLGLRQEFCRRHNNPLGLVYAVHCNADTQIQPALKLH